MALIGFEKPGIILCFGSHQIFAGISGDVKPREMIPTPKELFMKLKYLIRRVIFHILNKVLLIQPSERRLFVTLNLFGAESLKTSLKQVAKELQIPKLVLFTSECTGWVPLSRSSPKALIVDCGFKETRILPICNGVAVFSAAKFLPIGFHTIHKRMSELLSEGATIVSQSIQKKATDLSSSLVTDLIEKCCFFDLSTTPNSNQQLEYSPSPSMRIYFPKHYQTLATAPILQSDDEENSLASVLLDSLRLAPIDDRATLLQNIILLGGTSMLPGFASALISSVSETIQSNSNYSSFKPLVSHISIKSHPSFSSFHLSFVGSSILSSLSQYK